VTRGYRTAGALFLLVAVTLCDKGAFDMWNVGNVTDTRAHSVDHLERLKSIGPAVSFLKAQPGLFRVHVDSDLPPNIGDMYHVQATNGGMSATSPKSIDKLRYECGRLDLLNVQYLIRESKAPGEGIYEAAGWKVIPRPSGYPRAWLVHNVTTGSGEEVFNHLCSKDFNAREVAIVDSPLKIRLHGADGGAAEKVTVSRYEADLAELEVRAEGRALLVLSEMYYPGWIAEVNGLPADTHKVDGAFRGMVVPAGTSRVILKYAPRSVFIGAALTLLAFGGTFLFAFIPFFRRLN
jgi:hypothetical protein